jgi:uncharacterized Zn finger protein (UPF0148 family)
MTYKTIINEDEDDYEVFTCDKCGYELSLSGVGGDVDCPRCIAIENETEEQKMQREEQFKTKLADAIIETEEIVNLRSEIEDKKQEIEDNEDWEMDQNDFDDELDAIYGDVEIAGQKYSTSNALFNVDEVMYDAMRSDMSDDLREQKAEELKDELEDMENTLNDLLGEGEEQ